MQQSIQGSVNSTVTCVNPQQGQWSASTIHDMCAVSSTNSPTKIFVVGTRPGNPEIKQLWVYLSQPWFRSSADSQQKEEMIPPREWTKLNDYEGSKMPAVLCPMPHEEVALLIAHKKKAEVHILSGHSLEASCEPLIARFQAKHHGKNLKERLADVVGSKTHLAVLTRSHRKSGKGCQYRLHRCDLRTKKWSSTHGFSGDHRYRSHPTRRFAGSMPEGHISLFSHRGLEVWSLTQEACVSIIKCSGECRTAALSDAQFALQVSCDPTVYIYRLRSQDALQKITFPSPDFRLASSLGNRICASSAGVIQVWTAARGQADFHHPIQLTDARSDAERMIRLLPGGVGYLESDGCQIRLVQARKSRINVIGLENLNFGAECFLLREGKHRYLDRRVLGTFLQDLGVADPALCQQSLPAAWFDHTWETRIHGQRVLLYHLLENHPGEMHFAILNKIASDPFYFEYSLLELQFESIRDIFYLKFPFSLACLFWRQHSDQRDQLQKIVLGAFNVIMRDEAIIKDAACYATAFAILEHAFDLGMISKWDLNRLNKEAGTSTVVSDRRFLEVKNMLGNLRDAVTQNRRRIAGLEEAVHDLQHPKGKPLWHALLKAGLGIIGGVVAGEILDQILTKIPDFSSPASMVAQVLNMKEKDLLKVGKNAKELVESHANIKTVRKAFDADIDKLVRQAGKKGIQQLINGKVTPKVYEALTQWAKGAVLAETIELKTIREFYDSTDSPPGLLIHAEGSHPVEAREQASEKRSKKPLPTVLVTVKGASRAAGNALLKGAGRLVETAKQGLTPERRRALSDAASAAGHRIVAGASLALKGAKQGVQRASTKIRRRKDGD